MKSPPQIDPTRHSRRTARRTRWWPAWLILAAAAGGILWTLLGEAPSRQHRIQGLMIIGLVSVPLLLLWVLAFSRLPWRRRGLAVLGVFGGLLLLAAFVRIRGVSGDLVPIFEWRWQGRRAVELAGAAPMDAASPGPAAVPDAPAPNPDGWPQFLGPTRDCKLPGPRLATGWSNNPPREIWRRPVGGGWAGFAVARGVAVTQEQRGEQEVIVASDARTGQPLWTHADPTRYATTIAGEGPRAVPAIAGERVFTAGATGILNCLELNSGRLIWSRSFLEENGGKVPEWGTSVSPLVHDGLVIVSAGGTNGHSLVAYDRDSGRPVWAGGHDRLSYSSPVLLTLGGEPQVVILNHRSVAGHDPRSGRLLWEFVRGTGHPHVAAPVLLPGDRVLVSSGYGVGSDLLDVRRDPEGQWSATRRWKTIRLKAKFTNVVFHDGFIYGLDDGTLTCLDAETGEPRWKEGRYGHGQVILVGGLLLLTAENGEVALLDPSPEGLRELARFRAFTSKTWNPPALAGEYLFVRNDLEAACFRLPLQP